MFIHAQLGGVAIVLDFLQRSIDRESVAESLRLLHSVLHEHPRNYREMSKIGGYDIVTCLLADKARVDMMDADTIAALFELIGG
jgi:hypothetical protein